MPIRQKLRQSHSKLFAKDALSLWCDRDRARAVVSTYPALRKAVRAYCCADSAGEMRASFAPIEARPAQQANRALAAAGNDAVEVDANRAKKPAAGVGNQSSIACQLHMAVFNPHIRERHAQTAGKVVVAGPRCPQRGVSRTDNEARSGCVAAGCHLHDALQHLRHGRRCQAVVVVAALLLDIEKTGRSQARQMAARCLWRDSGVGEPTPRQSMHARPSARGAFRHARDLPQARRLLQTQRGWPFFGPRLDQSHSTLVAIPMLRSLP
jgi:hypothetical protein